MLVDFGVFTLSIALLFLVGTYRSRKIKSEGAYLFANREAKWGPLTATLVMTEFNSGTLIAFSSLGYAAGFRALLMPLIFLIGLLFYALTVAKKWKGYDGISVAGFFRERYGKRLGIMATLFLLFAMTGFSAAYVKSLTLLFHPLYPSLSPWVSSGVLLGIVTMMSLRGGLLAIIRTDCLSFFFALLFFPGLALYMGKWGDLPPLTEDFSLKPGSEILSTRFILSLTVLTMFTYIFAPWYGQKIFAAKSKKTAFWAVFAAAICLFFLYSSAILATAFYRYRGGEVATSQEAFPAMIQSMLPHGMRGAAYALLFATGATTLTGVWSAMAAMWIGDFRVKKAGDWRRGFQTTFAFALLSYLLANTLIDQVFEKMILANIPVAALSFGLLAGFYWKGANSIGVALSIGVGLLVGVGAYLIFGEERGYTWYWALYGIPLLFLCGILVSVFTKFFEIFLLSFKDSKLSKSPSSRSK